ncbi:MAG TPA: 3-hydroxyacyl-CoA dehydrogenase NAD-binding domain-containing protein [Methylomirabilota bacterium]
MTESLAPLPAAAPAERPPLISSVAVLGAGTMGAQIAAHFANAGVPALLLDLDASVAREGLERARRLKPAPFFSDAAAALVTTGGFDADLPRIADADWIIEAVVERLDVKRALLERVDALRRPGTLISSNTSGIPIATIAEGRSEDFRRHWLGTHFFNPPRYLRLLEVIPTADTLGDVIAAVRWFADHRLGKGVVIAKDTPSFIANHVALYGVLRTIEALESGKYTVEEVDAITGPALGRPKSATFRTMDLAGLDVLALVVRNLHDRLTEGRRDAFGTPPLLEALVSRGWLGEKSGRGFYQRVRGAGGSEIHALDPATLEYRPPQRPSLPSLEAAKSIEDAGERVRTLFAGQDRVGEFLRRTLAPTLVYTARVAPEIAYSIDDVDRVMQWGFGWELGPFELIDAIGARTVMEAWRSSASPDEPVPPLLAAALEAPGGRVRPGPVPPAGPDLQILRAAKDRQPVVRRNGGASLVDLGDGVLAVEFHSKMNAIGGDTIEMLMAGVAEAERRFAGLVVGNDAVNFSAGANLMLLLLEAQEGNWDEVDLMVRSFQRATAALRYARVPVVVAPAGLTLGGGCEVALHADRVQAAAETYIGLVEAGVGLIPAGGGTKEMLARAAETVPPRADLLPAVRRVFETIGFAKVSTSAPDALALGYLRPVDGWSMNRDRLLFDAKQRVLERVREGYQPPPRRTAVRVGGDSVRAALALGVHLAWRGGRLSDHDALIGRHLATVLSGGAHLPHETMVSEEHLLDLEREAFVSLCGERKTLERIQHTLKTGRPLRN